MLQLGKFHFINQSVEKSSSIFLMHLTCFSSVYDARIMVSISFSCIQNLKSKRYWFSVNKVEKKNLQIFKIHRFCINNDEKVYEINRNISTLINDSPLACSSTSFLATLMGFLTSVMAPTAPNNRLDPSIRPASISSVPDSVRLEPYLNHCINKIILFVILQWKKIKSYHATVLSTEC